MKQNWWKILGVLLWIYVLIAGFLVPLKPGVYDISPRSVKSGESIAIHIEGYNTNFKKGDMGLAGFLKIDSVSGIKASAIDIVDERNMVAKFDIPNQKIGESLFQKATLLLSNTEDGAFVYPDGITIDQREGASGLPTNVIALPYEQLNPKQGFNFPFRNILYETVRNTFFHVSLWFSMFILLIVSLVYSIKVLRNNNYQDDFKASAFTKVAILFGLLGLATGSIWARYTWGKFWTTDIKLNMSAIAMLIYLAYLILRSSIQDEDKRARVSAAFNIFAFVALIPLIFVIPRLTSSLHPGNGGNPALGGEDLDNTLRMVFYPAIIGLTLLGVWMAQLKYRFEIARKKWLLNG